MNVCTSFVAVMLSSLFLQQLWAQPIPFDSDRWEIDASESRLETHLGQNSLYMKGGQAILKDSEFTNGTIEFDISVTGERGFMGGIWRVQDKSNYEEFYIRPHQSGFSDANQYSPVFNRLSAWQLYHGEGYGAAVDYPTNEWIHIRIVVNGSRGEVFFGENEEPGLVIHEMKREVAEGKVGLNCSNFAPAYFANFFYTPDDNPKLIGEFKEPAKAQAGTIMEWSISSTLKEPILPDLKFLSKEMKEGLEWHSLSCESNGLANISRILVFDQEKNTTFARLVITSDKEQTAEMLLGYSDRARVFFNDRLLYAGQNNYRSRDYRYLGTIGLFDAVYLPLKKGENEVWIAVSESFGGWGLLARLEEMDGVEVSMP